MTSVSPQVVHVQQPVGGGEIIRLPDHFTQKSMNMVCNVCRQHIQTSTEESCNPICCVLFGMWAMCCCQDVEHKCPNCNAVLGKYKSVG